MTNQSPRQDIYSRVTARILAELEKGVRPWIKPWSVEHAAGRITREDWIGQARRLVEGQ